MPCSMKNLIISSYWIIIALLYVSIYFIPNLFPICIAALFLKIIGTEKDSLGVFLLMYGGSIGGIIRTVYPMIPIYGLLLNIIGLFLIRDGLFKLGRYQKDSIFCMVMVIFVFFISYLFADHTDFANQKIKGIILHGIMLLPGYYVLSTSKTINNVDICQLLLLSTITFIAFIMTSYGIRPSSINDINWLRPSLEAYEYINKEATLVGYQQVGMSSLFGLSFFLASTNATNNKKLLAYVTILSFVFILISGARQAILGVLVLLFLRLVLFNRSNSLKKILYLFFTSILLYLIAITILDSGIESVSKVQEDGIGERELIFLDALRLFTEKPFFGVGLGGFALHTLFTVGWPHNMILEILCETGLVGFLILSFIVIIYWCRNHCSIFYQSGNGSFYYLLIVALLIRVMVSSHLGESIEIFSALLAVSTSTMIRRN